jgi:hypothetical protein
VAVPAGYPLRRIDLPSRATGHTSGRPDWVEDDRGLVEVLLVRPGQGSWSATVGDGGAADDEAAALKALGIGKAGPKIRIPSLTGTARYRIPDALTDASLIEIKGGISELRLTDQIKDFSLYAQKEQLQFILIVRQGTKIADDLLKFAQQHKVVIFQAK